MASLVHFARALSSVDAHGLTGRLFCQMNGGGGGSWASTTHKIFPSPHVRTWKFQISKRTVSPREQTRTTRRTDPCQRQTYTHLTSKRALRARALPCIAARVPWRGRSLALARGVVVLKIAGPAFGWFLVVGRGGVTGQGREIFPQSPGPGIELHAFVASGPGTSGNRF